MLATSRSRRATAGNRLRALLDEERARGEEATKEDPEDVEFTQHKEEYDEFDQDFASTDEEQEGDEDDEEAGEKELERAEKEAKKAARQKAAAAIPGLARPKPKPKPAIRTPAAGAADSSSEPPTKKRRVTIDPSAVDPAIATPVPLDSRRQSSRSSTVLNRDETDSRAAQEEQRRASLPKPKVVHRPKLTQADLIAIALETEEANLASLQELETREEAKLRNARAWRGRKKIEGGYVRWVSRVEGTERRMVKEVVVVEEEGASGRLADAPVEPSKASSPTPESATDVSHPNPTAPNLAGPSTLPSTDPTARPDTGRPPQTFSNPSDAPAHPSHAPAPSSPSKPTHAPVPPPIPTAPAIAVPSPSPATGPAPAESSFDAAAATAGAEPEQLAGPHARNYVLIKGLGHRTIPSYETLRILFGSHVDWRNIRIVQARHRPQQKKVPLCPLTGLPAKYLDPRTGIPYANADAFARLTRLLAHEYVWAQATGAYVGGSGDGWGGTAGLAEPEAWADGWAEVFEGIEPQWEEVVEKAVEKGKGKGKEKEKEKDEEKKGRPEERKPTHGRATRGNRSAAQTPSGDEGGTGLAPVRLDAALPI